jgi:acyl-CoA reductase-like NAD-dependent aldehyde dehydrogenase
MSSAREYKNYIDGQWVGPDSGKMIERHSPANGKLLALYPDSTAADVERAVGAARRAFDEGPWPRMTAAERSRIMLEIARRIRENAERLAVIEAEEVGKLIGYARSDIQGAANHFEYAAALARDITGSANMMNDKLTAVVVREPVGVVGLITPWNFPLGILCQKLPYALATGNTVVIKPSEFTSGTTFELAAIAEAAGLPKGVINIVSGYGHTAGQALISDMNVDKISFTGSTATGKKIVQASAGNLKRVSLELGGKSPSIVFPDADLDRTVEGVLNAVFFMQGECCVSGSRLLVDAGIHDQLVDALIEKVKKLKIGDPLDPEVEIGPMIHEGHKNKVLEYVATGLSEGAQLAIGGSQATEGALAAGHFVQPTVFTHVNNSMRIAREEIFGPVLSVIPFQSEEEAIRIANDTPYGLAASVWTENIDRAFRVAKAVRAGTVWVNGHLAAYPELPFGGYKQSGLQREMGRAGIESFTEVKTIQIHHL